VSIKQNFSVEQKEPDPALEITMGIKEIEKSMLKGSKAGSFMDASSHQLVQ
jgi:hypothetical protein